MYFEYQFIIKYIILLLLLGFFLFWISFFFVFQKINAEKTSAYECGFNTFGDARTKFEVRYYLIAILFIIFDLELLFLFPWVVCVPFLSFEGLIIMIIFLFFLIVGLIYEYNEGAFNWS